MKTLLKIIAGILVLLLVVAICVTLYFRFFFDPNDLRDQITQRVQDKTGRTLTIEGDLKISTFPWVSANIGRTTLSDDPAFGSEPLLSFEEASASVKLLPLLKKQVELGTTSIDGARINLTRLSSGQTNWGLLLDGDAASSEAPANPTAFQTQTLGAIEVTNATIMFNDQLPDAEFHTLTLSSFNLSTGELKPGVPFNVDLASRVDAANVGLDVALKARAELADEWLGLESPVITLKGTHYAVPFEQFDIEIDSDNVKLGESLVEMGEGTVNWQVSGGRDGAKDLASGSGSIKTTALSAQGENFNIANPELVYNFDFSDGSLQSVKGKLEGQAVSQSGDQITVSQPVLDFDAASSGSDVPSAKGTLTAQELSLAKLVNIALNKATLNAQLSGDRIPDGPQDVMLDLATLALNLDNGALNVGQYSAEGFGLKGRGTLKGTNVLDAPTLSGPLNVEQFNLRELLTKLDVDLDTADANALSKAQGRMSVRITPNGLELRDLEATLDQSKVTGLVKLTGVTPEVSLSIDTLKLDGYLSPPDNIDGQDRAVDTIELPAQTLRDLNLNGQLRIGSLDVGGIASTNVEVQLAASEGDVRLYPVKAQLYGGSYSGDVRLNAQGELPQMSLNESFNNVDFGALSMALAETQRLSGRVTGSLKMTASGHNTRDLKATSNGTVAFKFDDGVLDGINVMETVRNIVAAANKESLTEDVPDRTEFRSLEGTATITQGVLANDDLKIDIPLMRIGGRGTLDLNTKAIDYRVSANVVQEGDVPLEKELRFISDYTLPLVIGGTYEAPKVDATRSIADLAGQYAKKRLQDKLLDKLGLGGKDEAPEEGATPDPDAPELTPEEQADKDKEALKDELDQKLKDKLKDLLGGD